MVPACRQQNVLSVADCPAGSAPMDTGFAASVSDLFVIFIVQFNTKLMVEVYTPSFKERVNIVLTMPLIFFKSKWSVTKLYFTCTKST